MTEKEKFMYQIMSEISRTDAPIVFKGAMITKLILAESDYTALERQTRDVDANWVGESPTMDTLVNTINDSLGAFEDQIFAVSFRNHGERMSAGVSIREKQTDEELFPMDIDMRPIHGSMVYNSGEISVKGVLLKEILSDKIVVLSDRMIFRRAKDVVDVYALAHCVVINTFDIFEILRDNPDRELGEFNEFNNRRQDVEHAYNKLKGIKNKPPFDHVYQYLKDFLQPFILKDMTPKVWNSVKSSWDDLSNDT